MKHTLDKYPVPERYAQVTLNSGKSVFRKFDDLKKGDKFILFEPNGDELVQHKGAAEWVALEDACDGVVLCESVE